VTRRRRPRTQTSKSRVVAAIARLRRNPQHTALSRYADRLGDVAVLVEAHLALEGAGQGGLRNAYAINRAALTTLTGHFAGYAVDLFEECWALKYGAASVPARLTDNFNNPWPAEIDRLYRSLGHQGLTLACDPRALKLDADVRRYSLPTLVREPKRRTDYRIRAVIGELVQIRNASAHGGSVLVRMRDVTNYLDDTVGLAIAMDMAT
jgi:hypothetical protein